MGGGWRSLLSPPLFDALRMLRYYVGVPFCKISAPQMAASRFNTKYNASNGQHTFLFRSQGAFRRYGWAIHKPMQLIGWLQFSEV